MFVLIISLEGVGLVLFFPWSVGSLITNLKSVTIRERSLRIGLPLIPFLGIFDVNR